VWYDHHTHPPYFPPALLPTLRWLGLFGAFLRVLSPVLRTLIVSWSDDTIYALTVILSASHVIFHDYSWRSDPSVTPLFRGTVSLNAAMFAAVLLASRCVATQSHTLTQPAPNARPLTYSD
jgi:hypothetical protein